MLRFLPFVLIAIYLTGLWWFSSWRGRQVLNKNATPLQDHRLAPLLERLGQAMSLPPISAYVYEVENINGLASSDGRVFVTRGFLRKLDAQTVTPEEVISVIAHELGHVSLGHSRRRMIDFAGQNFFNMALGTLLGRFIPGFGHLISKMITGAIAAGLSRQDEFEADKFATALMIKAGLGPRPQISLLEKLERLTGHSSQGQVTWFMSHPPVDQRITAIQKNVSSWQIG